MSSKQSHINNSRKFDTAFINPCINRVLEAIGQQNNGSRVLLVFENPINRTDNFQLTETFPLHIFDFPKAINKNKLWEKLFLVCPHLVQPQKVIYSHTSKVKTMAKFASILFKNKFNAKSISIDQKRPSNLSFIKVSALKGVIIQEFKINVSRLFIELLKYFELNGGEILLKAFRPKDITTIIQCNSINKRRYILAAKVPANFAWITQVNKATFCFVEKENRLQVDTLNKFSNKLSKEKVLIQIKKLISFELNSFKEIEITSLLSSQTLKNILNVINKTLPGSFENTKMEDNYELGLEKFDIAKQTGINYPEFKILFHRYGIGIDKMIDNAYERLHNTRDPQKIWNETEDWFQKEFEWKD